MPGPRPDDTYNPVQTTEPIGAPPNDYLGVRANPNQFGAQIGGALEKGGEAVTEVGKQAFEAENQRLILQGDMAANSGSNTLANNYVSMEDDFKRNYRGQNAVNQLPLMQQAMQKQMTDIANTMPGPLAKEAYLRDARSYYNNTITRLGAYVDGEAVTEADKAWQGRLKSYDNQAVLSASNPAIVQHMLDQKIEATLLYENQFKGTIDPDAVHAAVSQASGQLIDSVVSQLAYGGKTPLEQKTFLTNAQTFLDQYKGKTIPGEANTPYLDAQQADQIQAKLTQREWYLSGKINTEAARGVGTTVMADLHGAYLGSLGVTAGTAITSSNVLNTLAPQESGGRPNILGPETHLGRAGGKYQITEALFNENKQLGQDFTKEADREDVSNKIMSKYLAEYKDPARAMVAWYSGPGNVSPAGSPLPYIDGNKTDGIGKMNTAQYVETGMAKLNGSKGYSNIAYYAQAHYPELEQHATDLAIQQFPDRPDLQQTAVQSSLTWINNLIHGQEVQDKSDSNNIYSYLAGNNQFKAPVNDINQLENGPPEIKDAWERMKANHGGEALNIESKLIRMNSTGMSNELGTQFWQRYADVMNGVITKPDDLSSYLDPKAGKNAVLTNTGFYALQPLIQRGQTPEGQAFNTMEKGFFERLRGSVTGTGVVPGAYTPDQDKIWNQFMAITMPKIETGYAHGLRGSMFDEKSKDYVGDALPGVDFKKLFKELTSKEYKAADITRETLGVPSPSKPVTYNSLTDLNAGVKAGKVDKTTFAKYWHDHPEWHQPEVKPDVPLPTGTQ